MSEPQKKTTIKCATCGKPTSYFTEPLGPFCSTRCKMVDLGRWFGEEYRISEPLRPDHLAQFEELSDPEELDRKDE